MEGEGGFPLPDPADIPEREREDAMGAYLMMFASLAVGLPLPFIGIVASIVYYAVNRRRSPFVAFHSLQALLAHVPVAAANGLLAIWALVTAIVGRGGWIPVLLAALVVLAVNAAYIAVSVVALRRASRGVLWYLPLIGSFAFDRSYGERARERETRKAEPETNRPPY